MASKWVEEGLVELGIKESPDSTEFDFDAIKAISEVMDNADIATANRHMFVSKIWGDKILASFKETHAMKTFFKASDE